MVDAFTLEAFTTYFFSNFSCIMVKLSADETDLGKSDQPDDFWKSVILGCFYVFATVGPGAKGVQIKPNYPGRCSHVCNAGYVFPQFMLDMQLKPNVRFLVPASARGNGVGRHLALAFLHFAPKLGYSSSVFNLVFATNIASIRLWEKLGFERIGIVRGAGRLKGHTEPVDAYIYGYQFQEESSVANGS